MTPALKAPAPIKSSKQDDFLVQECLKGSEDAWSALIDKYKNLIFSIPIKYGFSRDEATEIFQEVWISVLKDLSQLREPRALGAWLIQMTSHKCFRWKEQRNRYVETELQETLADELPKIPEELLREIEREQTLREALAALSPDCRRLVELLFFEDPPVPYEELSKTLGKAKGSIGATRMRCLDKLRRWLDEKGFR
jgi:RNA polymerase sigma factor (sigma-70 family)